MEQSGFKQYLYATGDIEIGTDIFPPEDATEIFMGCGPVSDEIVQLGAVMTPAELFYLDNYPSREVVSARPSFIVIFRACPLSQLGLATKKTYIWIITICTIAKTGTVKYQIWMIID